MFIQSAERFVEDVAAKRSELITRYANSLGMTKQQYKNQLMLPLVKPIDEVTVKEVTRAAVILVESSIITKTSLAVVGASRIGDLATTKVSSGKALFNRLTKR